ncbi:3721_t:CDS:2 [Dentiscutata erythropus]|uniref:3721_t:CDS:1 n=1 Tax=Dentiscutata erythropus TaxID=1348616 RepID=A0A9N9HKK6_9GLOM|nr:3721_t:CDS:2 [Dentiscutata erythropus]
MSQTITRDITTHFTCFVPINYKIVYESFIIKNNIPWWNIDFERSYIIVYKKRNPKEKFDMLEYSKYEKYFNFFKCKYFDTREFYPYLWQYDKCHNDNRCSFYQCCDYFKTLQSIDKNLSDNEKLAYLSKKNSLLRLKRLYSFMKLRYDIFFWIKNFSDTGMTQYKDEVKLLRDFKIYVISPEYHPVSPSAQSID